MLLEKSLVDINVRGIKASTVDNSQIHRINTLVNEQKDFRDTLKYNV